MQPPDADNDTPEKRTLLWHQIQEEPMILQTMPLPHHRYRLLCDGGLWLAACISGPPGSVRCRRLSQTSDVSATQSVAEPMDIALSYVHKDWEVCLQLIKTMARNEEE